MIVAKNVYGTRCGLIVLNSVPRRLRSILTSTRFASWFCISKDRTKVNTSHIASSYSSLTSLNTFTVVYIGITFLSFLPTWKRFLAWVTQSMQKVYFSRNVTAIYFWTVGCIARQTENSRVHAVFGDGCNDFGVDSNTIFIKALRYIAMQGLPLL